MTSPAAAPAAPEGLTATVKDRKVKLAWQPGAGTDDWEVHSLGDGPDTLRDVVRVPRSTRGPLRGDRPYVFAVKARNRFGTSVLSAAVTVDARRPGVYRADPDTAPFPAPAPSSPSSPAAPAPAATVPGDVLDLTRWYLTLPIADPTGEDASGPWDVYQPRLRMFEHPLYFRAGRDEHGEYVEYIAPATPDGAVTTSGSEAVRAELREMAGPDRTSKAAWGIRDGRRHALTVTLTVDGTSITDRKEVICGQIHGPGGTPPIILCVNHTRAGALEVFRQGPRQGDLLAGLGPSDLFTYRVESPGDGWINLYACLGTAEWLPGRPAFSWPASAFSEVTGYYFKAGAYNKTKLSTRAGGRAIVRHYRCELV